MSPAARVHAAAAYGAFIFACRRQAFGKLASFSYLYALGVERLNSQKKNPAEVR
jgi:hypothetical protein